jgi:hypothetical protein
VGIEFRRDRISEFCLSGPVVGEHPYHRAAGWLVSHAGKRRFDGARIGGAREQLSAVDQIVDPQGRGGSSPLLAPTT